MKLTITTLLVVAPGARWIPAWRKPSRHGAPSRPKSHTPVTLANQSRSRNKQSRWYVSIG